MSLFIAEERGYFRDEGLSVTTQPSSNGSDVLVMLNTGDVDFVPPALGAALLNASSVLDFRILMSLTTAAPGDASSNVVVRRELVESGGYRSLADLKNRKFAVVSENSLSGYLADRAMRTVGLTLADTDVVAMSYADMAVALSNGAVDAAQMTEPYCTILHQRGVVAAPVAATGDLAPGIPTVLLLATPDLLAQRGEAAQRMLTAVLRGIRDYYRAIDLNEGGRNEILDILAKYTAIKDRDLLDRIGLPHVDPNGRFNFAAVDLMQDYFISRGAQPQRVDLSSIVDYRLLDTVIERLGPAKT